MPDARFQRRVEAALAPFVNILEELKDSVAAIEATEAERASQILADYEKAHDGSPT